MDYKELSQQIELSTSGLSAGTHVLQHHSDNYSYEQKRRTIYQCFTILLHMKSGLTIYQMVAHGLEWP
jgi:hypothetical protein